MRVCGVICEYDPFHNGHAYHLRAVRERTGCDYIVCAMSGHFTQRGHAALLSKWARAEMALRSGADAVFELPALFAVRDAEHFALGGVALLASLGVVTHLGFGSETGDAAALRAAAGAVAEPGAIKEGLRQGKTLARARGEAMGLPPDTPNDTLAMEYLRAIARYGNTMEPAVIRREGHGYHDQTMGRLASATAIRAAVRRGEDVRCAMPAPAYALLGRLLAAGAVQRADGLDTALLAMLRAASPAALEAVLDVGEGLENRLSRAALKATDRERLLEAVKTKRYTRARLSRTVTQAMLGITKELAASTRRPGYARLLGFREGARPLLSAIREAAEVPVVTRAAKFRREGGEAFALDLRAGDLWALGLENQALRVGGMDLSRQVIIISENMP